MEAVLNKNEKMLSIVIPAYNEEKMIFRTTEVVASIMDEANIPYQIVFVNDGSKDNTWKKIEDIAKQNSRVVGVNFSRNFGKESAIFAGLANSDGACVVVMDCDLQHPPQTIVEMYHLWEQGYEVVEGVKNSRGKESILHTASAGMFYKIMSAAVKIDMSRASDFKLMDKKVVKAILSMPEKNVFFRALSSWVGYKTTSVSFDVQEREEGESKWSTWSLIKYAIRNIVSFSTIPMQLVTVAGVLVFVSAIILGIQSLFKYFAGYALEGFTTVILLLLMIGSVIMISLGIIGVYLSKIYEEVKGRPLYFIDRYNEEKETNENLNKTGNIK